MRLHARSASATEGAVSNPPKGSPLRGAQGSAAIYFGPKILAIYFWRISFEMTALLALSPLANPKGFEVFHF
jgi:hypothetical protein